MAHEPKSALVLSHIAFEDLGTLDSPLRERGFSIECASAATTRFPMPLDSPFIRLRAAEGLPTMVVKFSTDIPYLSNWGKPLLLGPGSIHVAHTPQERLAKRELHEAVELYIKVAKQLLS